MRRNNKSIGGFTNDKHRDNTMFEDFINNLGEQELSQLESQLSSGRAHELIHQRKRALNNPMLVCPVCEAKVCERENLVLEFGPNDFRQKARFCGLDCLEFFLEQQKSLKQKRVREEEYATQ